MPYTLVFFLVLLLMPVAGCKQKAPDLKINSSPTEVRTVAEEGQVVNQVHQVSEPSGEFFQQRQCRVIFHIGVLALS